MALVLFNTLTNKKEIFKPLNKKLVSLYHCGPTVYQNAHIGNYRPYVFADILRRTLEYNNYKVKQIINITDVGHLVGDGDSGEDKVEKAIKEEKKTAKEITKRYTKDFLDGLKKLNINTNKTKFPKATDHIKEQIKMIQVLEKKGFTYKTTDGIYFDTSKFKNYGKLGNINLEGLKEGARVEKSNEKKNLTDFALWKFSNTTNGKREQEWKSPWGIGFPGWHIECSAMSIKYLSNHFDIHTGGIEHIPIHHNNEIAQSECATNKHFVNYWLHHALININGQKISKSVGNTIYLKDLLNKEISHIAYRYWLLMAHYKTSMNFNWEAIEGTQNALMRLYDLFRNLGEKTGKIDKTYQKKFQEIINDDLDTPQALALLWDVIKDKNLAQETKKATILNFDKVLALNFKTIKKFKISKKVMLLIKKREQARKNNNWNQSDNLRDEIARLGYRIDDTSGGSKLHPL